MAINFNELKKTTTEKSQSRVYSDLSLDFEETVDPATGKRDARADYDILAVRNSVINIFSINRGENLLVPDFGSNLRAILFEPITENGARRIGDIMLGTIKKYEPRITVRSIQIFPDIDNKQYDVILSLSIRGFSDREVTLSGIFNENNFNLR